MAEFSNPEAYELWMGRWSDRLAPAFVRFAGPPESGRALDVGSGTGAPAAALLADVAGATVVAMDFIAFDDYWAPFLSGVTPTSSFAGGLAEDQRAAVEDRLRQATVGPGPDRPFSLPARAWAVRGTVPAGE